MGMDPGQPPHDMMEVRSTVARPVQTPVPSVEGSIQAGPACSGFRPADHPGRPWGFWATTGFGVAVSALGLAIEVTAGGLLVALAAIAGEPVEAAEEWAATGLVLSLIQIPTAYFCGAAILGIVLLRRLPVGEYLGLRWPGLRSAGFWAALFIVLLLGSDAITKWAGRDVIPEFVDRMYRTAGFVPVLVFALVVGAPFIEELFFRGFLYAGYAASPLGAIGAIVLPTVWWALLHQQYDGFFVGLIFVQGLYLAYVRHRTGSTILAMVLHGLANGCSLIQVAYRAAGG